MTETGGRVRERKKGSRRSSEAGETEPATTLGVAEEATIASAGDNGACSDGGCGENKCGSREGTGAGGRDSSKTGPLCNGYRSWEKLLHLRGIWAHGPSLQKQERKSSRRKETGIWRGKNRGNQ